MKIELDHPGSSNNRVESYSEGQVTVAGETFQSSIVLSPDTIRTDYLPNNFTELARSHVESILSLSPEVVILGTGSKLLFPDEDILSPFISSQIGYEIMDTGAACRSFNFLLGEGRVAVAALFMI